MWAPIQADNDYDPFPEFLYLGSDITDGLIAWIQVGINTTLDMTDNSYYSVAATLAADGGHENTASTFTGGGGDGGNGTFGGNGTDGAIPA